MMDELAPSPQQIFDLLKSMDSDSFGETLLRAAREAGPIAEVFLFRWTAAALPQLLHVAGSHVGAKARAKSYVSRYFHHDPMLFQHRDTEDGSGFSQIYRIGSIAPEEYQQRCFVEPSFVEKHSYGWRWPGELLIVNFYSQKSNAVSKARLSALANIVLATAHADRPDIDERLSSDWLAQTLRQNFPQLSARENLVCAKTIAGMSSKEIALQLNIGTTTVLTYRRRAYLKLGISRAGQLLPRIFDKDGTEE